MTKLKGKCAIHSLVKKHYFNVPMCKEYWFATFHGKITLNHVKILLSMLPDITLILISVLL